MIITTARRLCCLLGLVLCSLLVAACGDDGDEANGPTVVATTTQVADIAANVAGDRAEIAGIVPVNADPHDYEPIPSDAEALIDASLVIKSGGELDAWVDELVASSGSDATVVELLDVVDTIEDAEGNVDPHWWHDPRNAVLAVNEIADRLAAVDPDGEATYEANAEEYGSMLKRLDRMFAKCMRFVPAENRKIVTGHDSLGYLAQRYDIEIVGSALPALTTQAQASAGEVAQLVDLIRLEEVNAVFGEAGLSDELVSAIADEAGAQVGEELYADSLGGPGSGAKTYVSALALNARSIAVGMTGGGFSEC